MIKNLISLCLKVSIVKKKTQQLMGKMNALLK